MVGETRPYNTDIESAYSLFFLCVLERLELFNNSETTGRAGLYKQSVITYMVGKTRPYRSMTILAITFE